MANSDQRFEDYVNAFAQLSKKHQELELDYSLLTTTCESQEIEIESLRQRVRELEDASTNPIDNYIFNMNQQLLANAITMDEENTQLKSKLRETTEKAQYQGENYQRMLSNSEQTIESQKETIRSFKIVGEENARVTRKIAEMAESARVEDSEHREIIGLMRENFRLDEENYREMLKIAKETINSQAETIRFLEVMDFPASISAMVNSEDKGGPDTEKREPKKRKYDQNNSV